MRKIIAIVGAAALSMGATPKSAGWNTTVTLGADNSHILGNPAAKVKLVEYASYTCPHCARFAIESDGAMRIGYIPSGKLSFELRHVLRDPVDLTVAMLTNCGPKEKFFLNHMAFMREQPKWIVAMGHVTPAQKQRWTNPSLSQRNRAIAGDFHFYEIMQSRGYDRLATDLCLSNQALADQLGKQSQAAYGLGVRRTPSFFLNGKLLESIHEWNKLWPQIDASM